MHNFNIDEVLEHYIIAALWSTNDESDPSGGEPLDRNYTKDNIHPDTIFEMRQDVERFVNENWQDLQTWKGNTTVEQQTGHDFWLNRNGHGVGFWEPEWGNPGERLHQAAIAFGEYHLYVGDDGTIRG